MDIAIAGALAEHPLAASFAREVQRVHRRYALEVVAEHHLCPFVRPGEAALAAAFGSLRVVLDAELDVDVTCGTIAAAGTAVIHVVYPRVSAAAPEFEKFAAAVAQALRQSNHKPPVLAAFHPQLSGDASAPHRLVGLLRRAPDPFIQLIPEGLHEGGTTFAGALSDAQLAALCGRTDPAQANFNRVAEQGLDRLLSVLADIRADRAKSYAPFLTAFAAV